MQAHQAVPLLEQLPLAFGPLVLTSLVVCAGTALQVATGVGLGLLAGPVLVLTVQSETAIFVAIVLNLFISLALLPQERGEVLWAPLKLLMLGTVVGVPLGWLLLQQIGPASLKLLTGIVVLTAAAQFLFQRRHAVQPEDRPHSRAITLSGGGLSGFMSGCLAIPGPIAMWALLRLGPSPSLIRATLRALFVFSYSAAFLLHAGLPLLMGRSTAPTGANPWLIVAALAPALAVGMGLGVVAKRAVPESLLQRALRFLLFAMGISLLWKGLLDVSTGV